MGRKRIINKDFEAHFSYGIDCCSGQKDCRAEILMATVWCTLRFRFKREFAFNNPIKITFLTSPPKRVILCPCAAEQSNFSHALLSARYDASTRRDSDTRTIRWPEWSNAQFIFLLCCFIATQSLILYPSYEMPKIKAMSIPHVQELINRVFNPQQQPHSACQPMHHCLFLKWCSSLY